MLQGQAVSPRAYPLCKVTKTDQLQEAWDEQVRDRLSYAIKSAGMTQRALAEAVGLTEGAVSRWLSATTIPTEKLQAVCRALGVSADWLLGLAQERTPAEPPAEWQRFIRLPRVAPLCQGD